MLYVVILFIILVGIETFYKQLPQLTLKRIEFKRQMSVERVIAGEEAYLETIISNKKLIPLPWFKIHTTVPWQFAFKEAKTVQIRRDEACEHVVTSSLLFYEKLVRRDYFVALKRGYYKIDDFNFQSGDLFGWVDVEMNVHAPVHLFVHPVLKPLEKLIKSSRSLFGETSVRRWIVPDPLFTLGARDYTSSDPFSAIDWKATARVNRLQVKQNDYTSDRTVQIFLDTQSHQIFWKHLRKEAVERGIEIAASVIHEGFNLKAPVGLIVNNLALDGGKIMTVLPGLSHGHRSVLMDTLAMSSAYCSESMSNILRVKCRNLEQHTIIVLITACLTNDLLAQVNRLAKGGYHIKLVDLSLEPVVSGLHKGVEYYLPKEHIDQQITDIDEEAARA